MSQEQPNNPLQGVKLKDIIETLVDSLGWETLGLKINFDSFKDRTAKVNYCVTYFVRTLDSVNKPSSPSQRNFPNSKISPYLSVCEKKSHGPNDREIIYLYDKFRKLKFD